MAGEVAMGGGQEEAQAEEGLLEEHPVTPVAAGLSSAPDISPTQRSSSSSCRHYVKLLFARASHLSWEPQFRAS